MIREACHVMLRYVMLQRLLKMLEGLNFNEFIALLSAFSSLPEIEDKLNCDCTLCNVSPVGRESYQVQVWNNCSKKPCND